MIIIAQINIYMRNGDTPTADLVGSGYKALAMD